MVTNNFVSPSKQLSFVSFVFAVIAARNVSRSIDDHYQIGKNILGFDSMVLYRNQFEMNAIHQILIQGCSVGRIPKLYHQLGIKRDATLHN